MFTAPIKALEWMICAFLTAAGVAKRQTLVPQVKLSKRQIFVAQMEATSLRQN